MICLPHDFVRSVDSKEIFHQIFGPNRVQKSFTKKNKRIRKANTKKLKRR